MENGLLVYTPLNGKFNIGDYIQSLAAKQFFKLLPNIILTEIIRMNTKVSLLIL